MYKYKECLETFDLKKTEFEQNRVKLNQDIEEKKIRLNQINLEKQEIYSKNLELRREIEELNDQVKKTKHEYIDFQTQIKLLKENMCEKNEIIMMLTNEVETWMNDLYTERILHYNAEQNVSALELKLSSIKKDNK